MIDRDVVIVGGGPVGLMLAAELRLAGVSVTVLEKQFEPSGFSKALGIRGRTIDLLEHRGLLERFSQNLPPFNMRMAHFGGLPINLGGLEGRPLRFLPIPQSRIEQLLEEHAYALGARIRWEHELIDLQQEADCVRLVVNDAYGQYQLRARFVVGCDGADSTVRQLAGISFPGSAPTMLLRLGDIRFSGAADDLTFPLGIIPLGAGVYRVVTREPYPAGIDPRAPMGIEELRASFRRTFGVELPAGEPRWLARFTDSSRQAAQYRKGRVLLAGDAAHTHLPVGGPGLGTGLEDASNLGWKLAAELRGWAPPGLLDSYHAERHPVGARVLMHTRAQSALLGGGAHTPALRELFGELLTEEQALPRIVNLLQGTDISYPPRQRARQHALEGQWVPNLRLATTHGKTRVAELMRSGRGVLLDLSGTDHFAEVACGWADRVDTVVARCAESELSALLIRPDGYVAWATDSADAQAQRALHEELGAWFGAPQLQEIAAAVAAVR